MRDPLRLSVLDQSPVPDGSTPSQALANSLDLARHVDRLGYTRLWYSEHHAMDLLACTAPEILINTITHSHAARLHSYTLLAEAMELPHEESNAATKLVAVNAN